MKTLHPQYPGAPMQGYATVPATSDAKEYLRLLLRHKFGLLLTVLLGLALAWLYLISTDPVYETQALVEVNERGNLIGGDERLQQTDWNAPTIKEEANYIKSRRVLAPVIERFDLRVGATPKRAPVLSDVLERFPALAERVAGFEFAKSYAWGPVEIDVATLELPRQWQDRPLTLTALGQGDWSLADGERVLVDRASVGETLSIEPAGLEPATVSIAALDAPAGVEFTLVQRSARARRTACRPDRPRGSAPDRTRAPRAAARGRRHAPRAGPDRRSRRARPRAAPERA